MRTACDGQAAQHRFLACCRWVRWVAKKHMSFIFLSMLKVAKMIETNLLGILAHWKCLYPQL
jgi:hypothetical protein